VRTRTLSSREARVVLTAEAQRREELDLAAIESTAGVSRAFARKIAHDLTKKGWLQRLGRGRYLLNPADRGPDAIPDRDPLRVGAHLVAPYYFGFATAAELHGLLPELGRTYYVVTPRKGGPFPREPAEFRRAYVRPDQMFGVESLGRRGVELRVSDRERTLLDCLLRPELAGGIVGVARILRSLGSGVRWGRVERYLTKYGRTSLTRRLGYLTDHVAGSPRPPTSVLRRWTPGAGAPFVPLGSVTQWGRSGRRDSRWHIIENLPAETLAAEPGIR
jgi:predicted transcriptional regulator of viral defense system